MSSDLQPPAAPRRPMYLAIVVALVWLVGMAGSTGGCQTIEILRHPDAVRSDTERSTDLEVVRRKQAYVDAVLATRHLAAPVAAGELLLGSLLTITAGLVIMGRGRARRLHLQAIVAYGLFLPVAYVLRTPIRAAAIEAVATGPDLPVIEGVPPGDVTQAFRTGLWWVSRGALAFQLLVLILGIYALTRPRVRAFFAGVPVLPPGDS